MKILISHVYSNDNKGDAALLSVLISDIRRCFGNADITILTLDKTEKGETFDGVPVRQAFMYYARDQYDNSLIKSMYAPFVALSTLLWAYTYTYTGMRLPLPKHLQEIVKLYQEADLVIPVGGGYIRSKKGLLETIRLFFVLHPFLFTSILGKPTINYTQSIGPFGNTSQEKMARAILKKLDGIIVREHISFELLKKWGITKNVLISVDSGFLFSSKDATDLRKELHIQPDQITVGITVRNWMEPAKQLAYEKAIAAFADYVIEKHNAAVIFIPQVTAEYHKDDDRISAQSAYQFICNKQSVHLMMERYDHYAIKAAYGQLDYLIGTRFHSVIFALTSHVPSIAIEYEYKTRGIMMDLGLDHWIVNIQHVTMEELSILFDELLAQRKIYIHQLGKILPSYTEQSQNSIYFVKQIYENKKSQ